MIIPDNSTEDSQQEATLRLYDVRYGYPARPDFLGPVTLTIRPGECWGIIGPNGAGKSTLLRLMAGLRSPRSGIDSLGDQSLVKLTERDRAKIMAFVPQHPPTDIDATAQDVVMLGRFPHRSLGLFESTADYAITRRAMELTETLCLADRAMSTLSGGESQRVHVAAALAQEPRTLLLDEPTASLDLQHQQAIFRILRQRTTDDDLAVVVVTHDVNLARQYCSNVLLIHDGKTVLAGRPEDVVTPEVLRPVYGLELVTLAASGHESQCWVVPSGESRGSQ